MVPLDQLAVSRRRMLFSVAAKGAVASLAFGFFFGDLILAGWILSMALSLAWFARLPPAAPLWHRVIPPTLAVCLGPVALALVFEGPTLFTVLMYIVPLVTSVMLIESFEVVLGVVVGGWISNTLYFAFVGPWAASDVAFLAFITASVYGNVVVASRYIARVRQLDRDIEADQKRALRTSETRRAQAERLAIVGRLASGVAHEINNPLAFVKANVGVLRRAHRGDEDLEPGELQEVLNDINSGVDRICQIVADLKTFAREDSGTLEPVDLRETIQGAARLAAVRMPRDMKVMLELPTVLPLVRANQRKLSQVLLNLMVNAGEALEERPAPNPMITVRAVLEGEFLKVTLTDNGPGIPPALLSRMFEPFFTTKAPGKGTGLGLALSREYVTSFGGTLLVQNVEPQGAQFTLTLKATSGTTGETPLPGSLDLGPARATFQREFRRQAS